MAVALDKFVKQLEDSGIVAPGKLENFVPPKAHPKDAEELARQLVKADHLTPFQAQHVLQGKAKALILGNYTILDKIGAGGMGQVFKAEHRRMHRVVAIKMLPPAMTKDAAALARFEREVTVAAKLSHPNIVAAHDADEANGAHFLVMEYVEGKDLSVLVKKNGRFSVEKAVNYILQAARGLEFAHAEGVIHRDIKPANLLLDKKGVVKILDMGLARIDALGGDVAQAELTGTGAIMGTVDYMAPEQGVSTKDADARADIYSLGCSLHYLLIGKPTYGGESVAAKLLAHHHQPIPNLCALREDVPEQLQAVFEKMLAKKVGDRYQTMTEVVAALQTCGVGHEQSLIMQQSITSIADNSALTFLKNIPADTTYKPKPTKKDATKSDGGKKKLIYGAVGAGLLGVLILVGIIVSLRTKDGTLIVEINQPDVTVQVLDEQGKVEVSQKGGIGKITIGIDPGKHRLRVEKDGFTVFGESFEMGSGGKKEISAKLVPVKVVASTGLVGLPKPLVAPVNVAQAKAGQAAWAKYLGTMVEQKNPVDMTLVLIPPGEFRMGSTDEQVAAALKMAEEIKADQPTKDRIQKGERPQDRVVISKPLLMSATEVTVGQFRKFVDASRYITEAEQYGFGDFAEKVASDKVPAKSRGLSWKSPGYAVTDDSPVAQVTWNDACAYCAWLSQQEQRTPWYRPDGKGGWLIAAQASGYRLPTEAEWEYACRAGTTTQYSFGDDYAELEQYGWYNKNAGGRTQPVGLKLPNPFGLFDMHGNLQEWCQDFFDEKWYEKPQSNDPKGPSSGSSRVIRGGVWNNLASYCRSAYRTHYPPSSRHTYSGFRVVRVLDATADSRLASGATAHQPNQPWNTPGLQAWMKQVAALPAEKQIEAVSKKLVELNPGFGGTVTKRIEGGVVTELKVISPSVVDLSPVRALGGLKVLHYYPDGGIGSRLSNLSPLQGIPLSDLRFHGTSVSDLSALQGMPLTILYFSHTQVSDLSPLKGMPLIELDCHNTRVSDLSPLRGMRLTNLDLGNDGLVSDLSPLEGMPLTRLCFSNTSISDLSPLRGMSLSYVLFTPKNITKGLDVFRQMGSLTTIGTGGYDKYSPADFWKKYDAGEFGKPAAPAKLAYLDPAFQAWMKTVAAMPAEKQIEAVSKKLVELNPDFDGVLTGWGGQNTPRIENGVVTHLRFVTDKVTDISPVRALTGLKFLFCNGSSGRKGTLSNLSPLEGMPLESLYCSANSVSDLSPLTHMKLASLNCQSTQVSDLSPLQEMPNLGSLDVRYTNVTPASMAALQKALPNCKIEWPETGQFFGQLAPGPKPITNVDDPVFQRWMKDVAALPAEKQIEAVRKMLVEFNPGFDGKVAGKDGKGTPKIENNVVTEFAFLSDNVTDISPVRALAGLKVLNCGGSSVGKGKLSNLSSLNGMPLTELDCHKTRVSELSPLRGMRLTFLDVGDDGLVSDLSPLEGMPLKTLSISQTSVTNLSPLHGMSLSYFLFTPKNITKGLDVIRQMGSLTTIGTGGYDKYSPTDFWKKYDAGEYATPAAPANRLADINNSPAFQQWVKATQALPAEKQIEAVSKKLVELNPDFDGVLTGWEGKGTPRIDEGVVTKFGFVTDNVTDISPVQALVGLKVLRCAGSGWGITQTGKLSDITPLRGLQLMALDCGHNQLTNLSPLEGMKLTELRCGDTKVSDLSPLQGMPLTNLTIHGTRVSDLSPLNGMPLTTLQVGAKVFDLSPLANCTSLKTLNARETKASPASIAALQKALPNCKIEWDGAAKPITNVNDPAFQQWIRSIAAMPAEKQVEAVAKKLQELNPGFDGKATGAEGSGTPKIENGVVTEFGFITDNVTDISPVQALVGLKALNCSGNYRHNGKLADLSPLNGMKLKKLTCTSTQVSDLSPLRGMPLTWFYCGFTQVSNLSPLQGMPLKTLQCFGTEVSDLLPLRGMPLKELNCGDTKVFDLSPLQGMQLASLFINDTPVSNVSPLKDMSLIVMSLTPKSITSGLDIIRQMKSIKAVGLRGDNTKLAPAEFWKKYDAGEFGKPITDINSSAFQAWVKTVAALSAEQQIEAVRTKLMELNPGFDGVVTGWDGSGTPEIENGVVTRLRFSTMNVADISPVRALVGLKKLNCAAKAQAEGSGRLTDLLPLQGMKLDELNLTWTSVKDLTPLRGMPFQTLWCGGTQVSDITPLQECKKLVRLEGGSIKVAATSIAALQKALPDCKIYWDDPAKPKTPAASGTK